MNSNSNKARAKEILRSGLGINDATFHEHQWESISTLVNDRSRLLVVQRTGWGKSAVYFIATNNDLNNSNASRLTKLTPLIRGIF